MSAAIECLQVTKSGLIPCTPQQARMSLHYLGITQFWCGLALVGLVFLGVVTFVANKKRQNDTCWFTGGSCLATAAAIFFYWEIMTVSLQSKRQNDPYSNYRGTEFKNVSLWLALTYVVLAFFAFICADSIEKAARAAHQHAARYKSRKPPVVTVYVPPSATPTMVSFVKQPQR